MTTLFLKDLRLSLDALRPWAMIVAGLIIGSFFVMRLPPSLDPWGLRNSTMPELMAYVAGLVGASAIGCTAWLATTIVQGDRRHGARSLAMAVPARELDRVAAKVLAIVAVASVPTLVGVALYSRGNGNMETWMFALAVASASMIGAAIAMPVAALVRGLFQAVAIALLVGLVAGLCGAIAGWITFSVLTRELYAAAVMFGGSVVGGLELPMNEGVATSSGAIAGVGAFAAVGAVVGVITLVRPLRRRGIVIALFVGLGAASIVAAIAAIPSTHFDPRSTTMIAHCAYLASRIPESQIIAAIRRSLGSESGGGEEDAALVQEGYRRLLGVPLTRRASNPIAQAFRSVEDYSSAALAQRSLQFIPQNEPRRLSAILECILRYPDSRSFKYLAAMQVSDSLVYSGWRGGPRTPGFVSVMKRFSRP